MHSEKAFIKAQEVEIYKQKLMLRAKEEHKDVYDRWAEQNKDLLSKELPWYDKRPEAMKEICDITNELSDRLNDLWLMFLDVEPSLLDELTDYSNKLQEGE